MADNSPDSQPLGEATPGSAEESFDKTDSKPRGARATPGPEASPSPNSPEPTSPTPAPTALTTPPPPTTTTSTTADGYVEARVQPCGTRGALSPEKGEGGGGGEGEKSQLWNYAENRVFLIERLESEERRDSLTEGRGRGKRTGEGRGTGGGEGAGHSDLVEHNDSETEHHNSSKNREAEQSARTEEGTPSSDAHHNENEEPQSANNETIEILAGHIKPRISDIQHKEETEHQGVKGQSGAEGICNDPNAPSREIAEDENVCVSGQGSERSASVQDDNSFTTNTESAPTWKFQATGKEDASSHCPEHENSIHFNFTIFLQQPERALEYDLVKEPTAISPEAEQIEYLREMATTPSGQAPRSKEEAQDSRGGAGARHSPELQAAGSQRSAAMQNGQVESRGGDGGDGDDRAGHHGPDPENDMNSRRPPSSHSVHSGPTKPEPRVSQSSIYGTTRVGEPDNPVGQTQQHSDNGEVAASQGDSTMNGEHDDQSAWAAENGGAEFGSPTSRPKPPPSPFQKPSPRRMAELDRHVLATPKQLNSFPVFELTQYLLAPTRTEVESAYVIFRWVTCQVPRSRQGQETTAAAGAVDDEAGKEEKKEKEKIGAEDGETPLPTLGTYLDKLYEGRMDHSELFSLLCKCVNLETHKVVGRVRYYCPQPCPQLCRARPASWSTLLLPGGWGIVDCALGARLWASEAARRSATSGNNLHPHYQQHRAQDSGEPDKTGAPAVTAPGNVDNDDHSHNHSHSGMGSGRSRSSTGNRSESGRPHFGQEHSPQNFYFLPPPQLLVSSHFPDSPCWQLLPHPVAETDFHTAFLAKPHLHYLGVDLVSPTSLRLTEIAEEMDITWKLKGDGLRRFAFRLFSVSDGDFGRQELSRHGFLENQHSRGAVSLRLIPPTSGRYVCELYGAYVPARGNEMIHMCSFDLDFVKTTSTPLKFPHNARVEWGPGAECVALGLTPITHPTGCVNVDKGETELVFSFSKPLLVTQKLFSAAGEGQGTEIPHSTVNFRDSKNRIKILLRISDSGDYVLSIYAKEDSSSRKCQLVCNYLVLCDSGTPEVIRPFPSLPFNKLGPTKAFSDLRMKLVCPKRSCIVVAPYSGKVTFVFAAPEDSDLSCDLIHEGQGGEEVTDTGDYVQHTCQAGESVFRARLPLAGDYLFHLFGRPSEGEGHKFLLYSALIECAVPNKDCLPLPRVVPEWRSRVQILAPLRRALVVEAVTHFAVRAYKIKGVAVVGHAGVQHFINEDAEEDVDDDEGKADDDGDDGNVGGVTEVTETKELEEHAEPQQPDDRDGEQDIKDKDQDTANEISETRDENSGKTDEAKENGNAKEDNEGDADAKSVPPKDSDNHLPNGESHPEHRTASAAKKVTMKQEVEAEDETDDDDDDDVNNNNNEREDDWQVWRCKVKVGREDEGSGVKLCVQTLTSPESHLVCVAEFQVVTERNMAARLDHQHSLWSAAEANFKVRPDSGHRSDIDDEERQSAYFLDDEVYLSNPLGDDNSDSDDSDNFEADYDASADEASTEDDEDENDNSDSDLEDTTTSGSITDPRKQDRATLAGVQDRRSSRQNASGPQQRKADSEQVPATKKMNTVPEARKVKNDRGGVGGGGGGQTKRVYHASAVYNAPQPSSNRESRQQKAAALMQKGEKRGISSETRGGDKKKKPDPGQKTKESAAGEEKPHTPRPPMERVGTGSHKRNKRKNADGSSVEQDPGTRERALRNKLWKACQRREREAIRKAVRNYTKGGYPPCPDLTAAERLLHLFQLQDALSDALSSYDLGAVRQALTEVERHGYAGEMSVDCRKAHALLSPHRHPGARALPADLHLQTDMRTLREIRSYRCPPRVVHHVLVATLLLLGFHEGQTKTWKRCVRRLQVLGRQGILRQMARVREDAVHPEISARARQLLDKHSAEDAQNVGPGVLAVYRWATKILFRVDNLAQMEEAYTGDGGTASLQPASKRRQREIFRQQLTTTSTTSITTTITTTTSSSTTPTTTTTTTSTRSHHSFGKDDQKAKSSRHAGGAETPKNRSSNARESSSKDSRDRQKKGTTTIGDRDRGSSRKSESTAVNSKPSQSTVRQDKEGMQKNKKKVVTGRQTGEGQQTDAKRTPQPAGSKKTPASINPAWKSDSSQVTGDDTSSNSTTKPKLTQHSTPTKTVKTTQNLPEEQKTLSPGHQARPLPSPHKNRPEKGTSNPVVVSQQTRRPPQAGGSSSSSLRTSGTPKSSPERRPQAAANRASTTRAEEPREQLRCLSPHKSPLFRPANKAKAKADAVRSRPPNRPKTTPTPVLQSTFFFASLVAKEGEEDDDEEVNNNIPLSFKNVTNGSRTTGKTAIASRSDSRLGQRGGAGQRHATSARFCGTEITTPDI